MNANFPAPLPALLDTPPAEALAVFDFDNTCVTGDSGEAIFDYMIEQMSFAWGETLWNIIGKDYHAERIAELVNTLLPLPINERTAHALYSEYWRCMKETYSLRAEREGIGVAYPWGAQMLAGLRVSQVEELSATGLGQAYAQGKLRPLHRSIELMQACRNAGYEIWVVSASNRWAIATMIALLDLPIDGFVAMDVELDGDMLSARLKHPTPVLEGKVGVIQQKIGHAPTIVCGDSANDYPMMELATGCAVLIDHGDSERNAHAAAKGWTILSMK